MKKLIQMFKNLPPEMRMVIGLAGVGTPIAAIYTAKRFLFPDTPTRILIFYVVGIVIALFILGALVTLIFKRGARKRSKKMEQDLATDADSGRVSMDVAAAIKANNEKFFGAIQNMRKTVGINVYDLPWYIVIGDSGCGKTKLINEGGLQFSLGKPEGYQLGTLNYNWWFTEDAVFVDMAGRLCNPRDDADRREWEAFLNTVGRGRKGYPINGAIVCISAEHLLADPPEKIEQDANTTLERLRDVQTKLGVTFATYLVITKCDKIVGFMQLFDRAERDITVLNQMVGWSKPGEFNELYEPEDFDQDFETIYNRLHELRLRRLNDDADETDLGLAYSFPEEFRELREPLQTYIRTLFPKIKAPRAIKNLIFRGVYFTSATREGGLILKHLTERLGAEAAEQFAPLDLYPSKRPYFIRDLFFRKIFPEHGLVFRNEQEAVRSRRLTRILAIGSAAVFVLVVCLGWVASSKFGKIIDEPRKHAIETRPEDTSIDMDKALDKSQTLRADIDNLESEKFWARILSVGVGTEKPIDGLRTIQAAMFERWILRDALVEIGNTLRSTPPPAPQEGPEAQQRGDEYLAALTEYVRWFGCRQASASEADLDGDSLRAMVQITGGAAMGQTSRDSFFAQVDNYFSVISEHPEWGSPGRLLGDADMRAKENILQAVRHAHRLLSDYASLDSRHPNPEIREWMRIQENCNRIRSNYGDMLALRTATTATSREYGQFVSGVGEHADNIDGAMGELKWNFTGPLPRIPDLLADLYALRDMWLGFEGGLKTAYESCPGQKDQEILAAISIFTNGNDELSPIDEVLWASLERANLTNYPYATDVFASIESFRQRLNDVEAEFNEIIVVNRATGGGSKDSLNLTDSALVLRREVSDLRGRLKGAGGGGNTPTEWIAEIQEIMQRAGSADALTDPEALRSSLTHERWQVENLIAFRQKLADAMVRGRGSMLLNRMHTAMDDAAREEWGIAALQPDWSKQVPSFYTIALPIPQRTPVEEEEQPELELPSRTAPSDGLQLPSRRRAPDSKPEPQKVEERKAPEPQRNGLVPRCATRSFMQGRVEDAVFLGSALGQFTDRYYISSTGRGADINDQCRRALEDATRRYMDDYVRHWDKAYQTAKPVTADELLQPYAGWDGLVQALKQRDGLLAQRSLPGQMTPALAEALQAVAFRSAWKDPGTRRWYFESAPEYRQVEDWLAQSVQRNWSSDSRSVPNAQLPRTLLDRTQAGTAPWDALATAFESQWLSLLDGMVSLGAIGTGGGRPTSVDWNGLAQLRAAGELQDEKITGELVKFEQRVRALLSQELTNALARLQDEYFGAGTSPDGGWPYLRSGNLATVDFNRFKEFLVRVDEVESTFANLEGALDSSDPAKQDRMRFYEQCEQWKRFLELKPDLSTGHLELGVRVDNPIGGAQTAQHCWKQVTLDLGCDVRSGEGSYAPGSIVYYTEAFERRSQNEFSARWDFDRIPRDRPMTFGFQSGQRVGNTSYPKIRPVEIGRTSPLALCAFLHNASHSENTWSRQLEIDTIAKLREANAPQQVIDTAKVYPRLGMRFEFVLTKPLPEPITMLTRR